VTAYSLTEAPDVLPEGTRPNWLQAGSSDVSVGDLWLLSWNGDAPMLVVLARVIDDYVLGCPVTLASEPSFAPALGAQSAVLNVPLSIWPVAETGLGRHLLTRNYGPLISEQTARAMRRYAEDGAEAPLPVVDGDFDQDVFDNLLTRMQSLCFHEWPTAEPGHALLDRPAMNAHNASVQMLVDVLDVDVPTASGLLQGHLVPTREQVAALADHLDVADPAHLLSVPTDEAARALIQPKFKAKLLAVMARFHDDEASARRRAREEYALAARSDASSLERMDEALNRLLGP